jgi:hypothetical protein
VVRLLPEALEIDDELASRDPVLAQLAAAAVAGLPPAGPELRCRYRPWADLMRLTLGLPVDTLGPARPAPAPRGFAAPVAHCGGQMKFRALVRDRARIERFLRRQGLWAEPLGFAEARPPPHFRSVTRVKPTRQAELFE